MDLAEVFREDIFEGGGEEECMCVCRGGPVSFIYSVRTKSYLQTYRAFITLV